LSVLQDFEMQFNKLACGLFKHFNFH